eukprot:s5041_g4.t2
MKDSRFAGGSLEHRHGDFSCAGDSTQQVDGPRICLWGSKLHFHSLFADQSAVVSRFPVSKSKRVQVANTTSCTRRARREKRVAKELWPEGGLTYRICVSTWGVESHFNERPRLKILIRDFFAEPTPQDLWVWCHRVDRDRSWNSLVPDTDSRFRFWEALLPGERRSRNRGALISHGKPCHFDQAMALARRAVDASTLQRLWWRCPAAVS